MRPIQVTERSHDKKRTILLPLEIVFQPDLGGSYELGRGELDEENGICRFAFKVGGGSMETEVTDPWQMRKEFLELDVTWDAMTLGWGRFGVGPDDISVPFSKLGWKYYRWDAYTVLSDEFLQWQSLVRDAMTTKMSDWPKLKAKYPADKVDRLCRPMPLKIEWRQEQPIGIIPCTGIFETLFATLQVDALLGTEYRYCACRGCGNIFMIKREDQRYCSEECKHRQVVRDGRARQRQAALKRARRQSEEKSK